MIRTLIVEDDPMVSNINSKFINKIEGFELVSTLNNGEKAIEMLRVSEVDLILLDVYMPVLTGMELLRYIRQEALKIDIILITAATSPELIEEAMRLGVVDCILKPFDFDRFESALLLYRKRYNLFRSQSELCQQKLDMLQPSGEAGKEDDQLLPKGIDPVTLSLIRRTLKTTSSPLSAQDISDQIELSRITTRKYLEFLADNQEIELMLKYSHVGRPTKLYRYIS